MHEGHRKRMRERAAANGFDSFHDHELLEMLLYATCPRKDTNALAHTLIDRFGSFAGVLDASLSELMKVDGVGEATAFSLKLIPACAVKYQSEKYADGVIINSSEKAFEFLSPRYLDKNIEIPSALFLNNRGKFLAWSAVGDGTVHSAEIVSRKLVELCLRYNATQIIMCHNHPSGIAIPSEGDRITTQRTIDALKTIGVHVVDHIIVAGNDYVSMAESKQYALMFV